MVEISDIIIGEHAASHIGVLLQAVLALSDCAIGPVVQDALDPGVHSEVARVNGSASQYGHHIGASYAFGCALAFPDV
ncbi:hypothetical protein D3C81_2053350 [compost metagenome]